MAITLSPKSLRLLKYIAAHGGDEADAQLGSEFERVIEKVASRLHRVLLQEQGTPYGDEAAFNAIADYQRALSGEQDPPGVDIAKASTLKSAKRKI
jgi:hypothetical protein